SMVTNSFDYNGHYLDYYYPNLINYPTYEKDGQILDEDYVVGSFMQSRMYNLEGISCRDCHDMHTMKLKKEGNALCLQCHEKKYDSYQHHFHKSNTEASQCINCHMPGRYYMGVDFRRDHSFRVPRPDQTVKYGTPNACNNCHKDKTAQWASDFIIEKYGKKHPKHFSDWLLPGQNGNIDSLKNLIQQTDFPQIIRATAVNILSGQIYTQNELNVVVKMLDDKSPLVRREAISALVNMGKGFENAIEPGLKDSVRTVRIAAARYFIMNNLKTKNVAFEKAKKEFLTDLHVNSDFASGQHQLALYYMSQGDRKSAKKAYKKALEIDNYFNLSRMNLALMEYEDGNINKAEQLYKKVIQQEPDYSYPYFMLGLLYNEKNNDKESLKYLRLACEKQPFILRAYYNYALKLQKSGEYKQADKVIDKALKIYPADENILYIKMLGKINEKKTKEAKEICSKLLKISPGNQEYLKIMNSLR
ncbi:MAG TPA: tetratricopeptide repeat protein, partial [Bacteroidetes bacterium]|nr:tetratricopeptide repeat protein [Bacteroidota bacterium]